LDGTVRPSGRGFSYYCHIGVWSGSLRKTLSTGVIGVEEYRLYSNFEKAQGLRSGTKVQISGVDVGHVSNVKMDPSGAVRMEFTIRKEFQNWITDSATIYAVRDQNVISERVVNVDIRKGVGKVLEDGDYLQAGRAQDIETVLETVNQVLERVTVLINAADTLVALVMDTNTTVGALLGSKTIYEKLNIQLDRLDNFSYTGTVLLNDLNEHLPVLLLRSDTITKDLAKLASGVQGVPQKLDHLFLSVDTVVNHMDDVVDSVNTMARTLGSFVTSSQATLENADDLIKGISNIWIIRRSMPHKDSVPFVAEESW